VYVPDLDRAVQVFNESTLVENIVFAMDPSWDAWFLDAVVDPNTGYVYTAGAEGMMYVIDGTNVIGSHRLGWRVVDLEIDPERGYVYAAHSGKKDGFQNNISVFNINTQTVTPLNTASSSRNIAIEPNTGLVYVTNPGPSNDPGNDSVTQLIGETVLGNVVVGDYPWGVAVNPNTHHAYVTNRHDNTVTVFLDGAYIATIPVQGLDAFAVTVDTNSNDVYVANRGREFTSPWGHCDQASVTILH
jgi:DNA-binding beta-propeller fold protein YncE